MTKRDLGSALSSLAVLILARWISIKELNPDSIHTAEEFRDVIRKIGRTHETAFEIHIDFAPKKFLIIRECIKQEEYDSAVLLLFTVIEGEVNTALRMLLRIRGFSHGAITDTIKGVDFRSKLNVLLPLLGANPSPRLRQFSRQSQTLRNLVVHFRANPEQWADNGNVSGDVTENRRQAKLFFEKNPVARLEKDLSKFVDECVSSLPEVQHAIELLSRFRPA